MIELCRVRVQVLLPDARAAGEEGSSRDKEEMQNDDAWINITVVSR